MARLFLILVKKFGYAAARKMAPKYGISQRVVNKTMRDSAFKRLGGASYQRDMLARYKNELLPQIKGQKTSPQFMDKLNRRIGRHDARVARPVNERLRGMIESRAANRNRLERARRERLTPDEFEAGLPGIGQGLHTLDMRSGLYQKNIDKIIADAKKVGKAGVRKATSRKPLMETPYDKRDMALMAALLGTAGAVKYSGAADRVWEEE